MREEVLRIENVIQSIGGITYLDNIHLNVFKGEILGLIPLDNHGKRELIDLILQNVPIHFGRVYLAGQLVNYYEHSSMTRNPVYVIEKESKLVGDLKVADNIWVLDSTYNDYIVRENRLITETEEFFHELGLTVNVNQYVSELCFFDTVIIELIRAVRNGAQLVIIDDLSDSLNLDELSTFHKLLKHFAGEGISFLYIAGNHQEIAQVCERLVLFEKGRIRKVAHQKEFSPALLNSYRLAFSPPVQPELSEESTAPGLFQCRNLTTANLKSISFGVQAGECLTILDQKKHAILDLAAIVSGRLRPSDGEMVLSQKPIPVKQESLILKGIGYIPEDPVPKTLFYDHSYLENLTFLLDRKLRRSVVRPQILRFIQEEFRPLVGNDIDAPNLWGLEMDSLYSLVYLRLLLYKPKVVFIMQPFAHADMHLSARITELITMLKHQGIAIILLTMNLSDSLTVTDRLLVMDEGRLTKSHRNYNAISS